MALLKPMSSSTPGRLERVQVEPEHRGTPRDHIARGLPGHHGDLERVEGLLGVAALDQLGGLGLLGACVLARGDGFEDGVAASERLGGEQAHWLFDRGRIVGRITQFVVL